MQYLLLIIEERDRRLGRTAARAESERATMVAWGEGLAQRGINKASQSLRTLRSGVRIAMRDGARSVVDGPFAESKEVVGGFFLLECASKDEAVALAAECPAVEWATVELREVGPCDGA